MIINNPLLVGYFGYVFTGFITLLATLVVCSVVEWILHAKILHGMEGSEPHGAHNEHHTNHAKASYKEVHADEAYGVAPPFFIGSVALVALIAFVIGSFTPYRGFISTLATVIGVAYFWALGYIHKRVHEPKAGGWLETTRLYAYLDRQHHVHHGRDDRNFCILLPFIADYIFGTLHGHGKKALRPAEVTINTAAAVKPQ